MILQHIGGFEKEIWKFRKLRKKFAEINEKSRGLHGEIYERNLGHLKRNVDLGLLWTQGIKGRASVS